MKILSVLRCVHLLTSQTTNKVTARRSDVGAALPPLHLPPAVPLCCVCSLVSSSLTPHRGFPVRLLHFPLPFQNGTAY